MTRSGRAPALLRPRDRLPVLFVVGILLPGIVLVVFSARALVQERELAEQRVRERLDRAASETVALLGAELERWQAAVDELAASGALRTPDQSAVPPGEGWPSRARQAVEAADGGAIVYRSGEDLAVYPAGRLLYGPAVASRGLPSVRPVPGLAAAERAANTRNYPRAIELYERLLANAGPTDRALLLHRLARTSNKAGANEDALRFYGELQGSGDDLVGALPAALIAGHGICSLWAELGDAEELAASALELYTGLVAGRWPMEKARYLFYSEQARGWLGLDSSGSAADFDDAAPTDDAAKGGNSTGPEALRLTEARKLAFSATVELVIGDPRAVVGSGGTIGMAFWSDDPFVALVLPARVVETQIWQPVISESGDPQLSLALVHDDGRVVLGAAAGSASGSGADAGAGDGAAATGVTRELNGRRFPLAVQAWPSSPSTLQDDLAARQTLYVAMLTLVVALLAFGSYLTARTVRREVEVARLKSRFVSAVSHEFRSPLTGIRQLAEMLLRDRVPSEEKKHGYYRMIAQESSRLSRLVENVLDFSRIEEHRMEYAVEVVDAHPWLERVVEEFRQEVDGQGITIAAEIPETLPQLRGDHEALSCAVHNLLDNAVKYSPGSDTVWLEAEASNGTLAVRVRDRGPGISEADRRHVFEKFFRGTGEISEEVKGVGLGLSLVQHIVAAHGGSIALDSEPGAGSTFTIELPVETGK